MQAIYIKMTFPQTNKHDILALREKKERKTHNDIKI